MNRPLLICILALMLFAASACAQKGIEQNTVVKTMSILSKPAPLKWKAADLLAAMPDSLDGFGGSLSKAEDKKKNDKTVAMASKLYTNGDSRVIVELIDASELPEMLTPFVTTDSSYKEVSVAGQKAIMIFLQDKGALSQVRDGFLLVKLTAAGLTEQGLTAFAEKITSNLKR